MMPGDYCTCGRAVRLRNGRVYDAADTTHEHQCPRDTAGLVVAAPNAPAPASVADTKHAIGCAEDRGVSCDCGATNAMLARLDHLRAAKQAPAATAEPPAEASRCECGHACSDHVRASGCMLCDCPAWTPADALGAEVAFYAGRTLEAEADAVDWKLKAEAAVSEVAALRADREALQSQRNQWRATANEWREKYEALAAARQSPASAPQPDVWYRSTIRPSSIPYLTRSIREIDEP